MQNGRTSRPLEPQGLEGHRSEPAHIPGLPGHEKGDLSKFVEDAVNRRVLQCTIQDIWERNADADPDEVQRIVDEAVSEVRAERRAKQKADKA